MVRMNHDWVFLSHDFVYDSKGKIALQVCL